MAANSQEVETLASLKPEDRPHAPRPQGAYLLCSVSVLSLVVCP
jgi:hypothetical protein